MKHSDARLPIREMVIFACLGALTFALKMAMSYLPNIEPVSLLVMVYGVVFGRKALYPVYIYVAMEILCFGFGIWNVNYLYIWALLALAAWGLRRMEQPLAWAVLSGGFGLAFGALCAPVDLVIGGVGYAVTKWASGIPFDIAHCVGNFFIALILFRPVRELLERLYRKTKQ